MDFALAITINRRLARFTDRIVVGSGMMRDFYLRAGVPQQKLLVIPNGVQPGGYVRVVLQVGDASTTPGAVWVGDPGECLYANGAVYWCAPGVVFGGFPIGWDFGRYPVVSLAPGIVVDPIWFGGWRRSHPGFVFRGRLGTFVGSAFAGRVLVFLVGSRNG